jgi:glycogen operon protein
MLLLSNGTPMFVAGDEFMRTQEGNNNPYNQDNETSWIDWSVLKRNRDVFRFFQRMIAFRKSHSSLCRSRFWRDDVSDGAAAQLDQSTESRVLAFHLLGASQQDQDLYVMINASAEDVMFRIQRGNAQDWRRVVDTSLPTPDDIVEPGSEQHINSLEYLVMARSVVVLMGSA